ncbi:MAG TPA: hypothetical protein VH020_15660 [Stellaceae bacterium]|jgi:hypothetical protein|nr:hypothetical protein [Stellaceae bacterium]
MPLQETLNKLREKQQREEQAKQDKPKQIAEWKDAVRTLLGTIREYLAEYEHKGLLTFSTESVVLMEERLGSYEIDGMRIVAGPVTILIQPVGLEIIGAWGRVDMHRQGRAGESQRVMILRVRNSATETTIIWQLMMPQGAEGSINHLSRGRRTVPMTKEALEQAIEFLLS